MESAVGFYANKPLVVCCCVFRAALNAGDTGRRKLPGEERADGPWLHFCAHAAAACCLLRLMMNRGGAALTCADSLEMAERSLALSPDGGMPGTGRWLAKAGVGCTRGGL